MSVDIKIPKLATTIDYTNYINFAAATPASTIQTLFTLQMPHTSVGLVCYVMNETSHANNFNIWCEVNGSRLPDSTMTRDVPYTIAKEDQEVYLNCMVQSKDTIVVRMSNIDLIGGTDVRAIGRIVMWYVDWRTLIQFSEEPELNLFYKMYQLTKKGLS